MEENKKLKLKKKCKFDAVRIKISSYLNIELKGIMYLYYSNYI